MYVYTVWNRRKNYKYKRESKHLMMVLFLAIEKIRR